MLTRRDLILGWVATGAVFGLAGCGRDDERSELPPFQHSAGTYEGLVERAKREGALTIYSSANAARQEAIANAFSKRFGIETAIYRLLWAELDHKVYAEKTAGVRACDVACSNNPIAFEDFRRRGWLMPITDNERATAETWPAAYWNGHWATSVVNFHGICYNSSRVPADKVPTNWDDLLDPFFEGKILLLDPRQGVQAQLLYDLLLKKKGVEFLRRLRAQGNLIPAGPPALQSVGAGASLIFAPAIPPTFASAKATGMPLEIIYPDIKSYSAVIMGAVAGCPHPNAAKLYVDYTMSAEGQSLLNYRGYSPLHNVPGAEPLPDGITAPDYPHTMAHAEQIIAALT